MKLTLAFASNSQSPLVLNTTQKIGQGKFEVYHAQDPSSYLEYAIKIFPKDENSSNCFIRERKFISLLDHPNVIRSFPVLTHDHESDILVTEYAQNGDFFNLVTKGALEHEVYMRTYFHQLIAGLEYLHSQGIGHLDLKLENLLLNQDFTLKIIDFDQSHTQDENLDKCPGTNGYRCMEVIEKNCHDIFAADIYSAGIILYAFKTKKFPFFEANRGNSKELLSYDLFINNNDEFWRKKVEALNQKEDFFSEDYKTLLRGMLEKDPAKRWTLTDIKNSEWFNKPTLALESLKSHMKTVYERSIMSSEDKQKKRKPSPLQSIYSFLSSPRSTGSTSNHSKSLSALLSPKINALWTKNKDKQKLKNSNSKADALHSVSVLPPREVSYDSKFNSLNSSSKDIQGRPKTKSFDLRFWKADPPKEHRQKIPRKESPPRQPSFFYSPKVISVDPQRKNSSGLETSNVSNRQVEIPRPNNNSVLKTTKRFRLGCIGNTKLIDPEDIVQGHTTRKLNVL